MKDSAKEIEKIKKRNKQLEKYCTKYLTIGKKQVKEINRKPDKDIFDKFIDAYTESFWEDVDFIIKLKDTQFQKNATIITRVAFEKFIKLDYIMQLESKDPNKTDILIIEDNLRMLHKIHKHNIIDGIKDNECIKLFNTFNKMLGEKKKKGNKQLSINQKNINSFPKIKNILEQSQFKNRHKNIYSMYEKFSDSIHANNLVIKKDRNIYNYTDYRDSLAWLIQFIIEVNILGYTYLKDTTNIDSLKYELLKINQMLKDAPQ